MGEGTTGASRTTAAKTGGTAKAGGPAGGKLGELRPEIERIAGAAGCEVWHVELKGGTLRLFLDKPEGVTLSDCEHVSKQVSAYLDVVDFGKSRYVLEVSSPGLDRQLYRPGHYERFVGHKVRVTFEDLETGKRRTVVGRLEAFEWPASPSGETVSEEDARVAVVVEEPNSERLELSLREVRQARLEIEL
jgi:ribosome maturation factor RimP